MSKGNDSISKTLTVVISLCLVCAIIVAGSAVALRPQQEENKALDKQKNILLAADLLPAGATAADIKERYKNLITAKVVDLETGEYVEMGKATSLTTFVTSFAGHIAAEAARQHSDQPARNAG